MTKAQTPSGAGVAAGRSIFSLDGRTAFVVGADPLLIKEVAKALVAAGASVAGALTVGGKGAGIDEAVAAIEGLASLDILVNLAGFDAGTAIDKISENDLDTVIEDVVEGSFLISQAAAARMRAADKIAAGSSIIHVATPLARVGEVNRSLCSMAMHALRGLTMASATELGPMGIRVNLLEVSFDNSRQRYLAGMTTFEELAASIVYLASPAAAAMTGASLLMDGGWTAR